MNHKDFRIGLEFLCGNFCGANRYRCTDIGSRVVVAVCLSSHPEDPSWYNGPPYAVAEFVFDENDIPACQPITMGVL